MALGPGGTSDKPRAFGDSLAAGLVIMAGGASFICRRGKGRAPLAVAVVLRRNGKGAEVRKVFWDVQFLLVRLCA